MALSPVHRVLWENISFLYPFGNTPAKNVLEYLDSIDFGSRNSDSEHLKVLLLGCGDLRNVFRTTEGIPNGMFLTFHLNDVSPTIIARNILILYMITCGKFDFKKDEDLEILWNIWYNTEWDEKTAIAFLKSLLELLNGAWITFATITDKDKLVVVSVWQRWIVLLFCAEIPKIRQGRCQFMIQSYSRRASNLPYKEFTFPDVVQSATFQLILHYPIDTTMQTTSGTNKLEEEVRQYLKTGSTANKCPSVCINPTFLDPQSGAWSVHDTLCPFECYPPLSASEMLSDGSVANLSVQTARSRPVVPELRVPEEDFHQLLLGRCH